jgi:BirA family biotin operon repressor/biotin-[acetyl-CoA-carboxylase] ligase
VTAETLFTALSAKMLGRLAQWNDGEHFSTIRADWLSRAAGRGGQVQVRLAEDTVVSGRFEDVDEAGRLVLTLADGSRKAIAAGDVVALGEGR